VPDQESTARKSSESSRDYLRVKRKIENRLVLGLKEISLNLNSTRDSGAIPSLNCLETPSDYYFRNRGKIEGLKCLYAETMENIAKQDELYGNVLLLVKKGLVDIVDELSAKIQIDPYQHLGGKVQVLENHKKALEDKLAFINEDVKELENRLMEKDKELDSKLEEGRRIRNEKETLDFKLKELKRKVMFTKE